jgi:hypothetical protein
LVEEAVMSALVRVVLSQGELRIDPGQTGELLVTIQNLSEIVDQYCVEIDGLEASWFSIPISELSLFPQDQQRARISLHPPSGSEAEAGKYDFMVRVISRENPTERTSVPATLEVLPRLALEVGLSPERATSTGDGVFQVRLVNPSNVDLTVDLSAADPEEGCAYRFEPGRVSLEAGESRGITLRVSPKARPPRGEARRYDFTVRAEPTAGGMQGQAVMGSLEHRSAMPKWALPAAIVAALLLCCGVASVAGFALFGEEVRELVGGLRGPTPTSWEVVYATQTADAVAAAAALAAAQAAQAEAFAATQTAVVGANAATQTAVAESIAATQAAQAVAAQAAAATQAAEAESVAATQTAVAGENSATQTAVAAEIAATQTAVAVQASQTAAAVQALQTAQAIATQTAAAVQALQTAQAIATQTAEAAQEGGVIEVVPLRTVQRVVITRIVPKLSRLATGTELVTIANEDGHVRSDGTVNAYPNVGDTPQNRGAQALMSFDISAIPAGSTVSKVVVDFTDHDTLGDPFGGSLGDGCLRGYLHDYGQPDTSDYFTGSPVGALIRWCSTAELDTPGSDADMASALQSKLGSARFQLRLQFKPPPSDGDGVGDMVRFGQVKLTVTYQAP